MFCVIFVTSGPAGLLPLGSPGTSERPIIGRTETMIKLQF